MVVACSMCGCLEQCGMQGGGFQHPTCHCLCEADDQGQVGLGETLTPGKRPTWNLKCALGRLFSSAAPWFSGSM